MKGWAIQVSGKVQGVFYRASTVAEATRLGVKGTVKNLPNGDVFIEAFGKEEALSVLVNWCKQGPPMSNVTAVDVQEILWKEVLDFSVVY